MALADPRPKPAAKMAEDGTDRYRMTGDYRLGVSGDREALTRPAAVAPVVAPVVLAGRDRPSRMTRVGLPGWDCLGRMPWAARFRRGRATAGRDPVSR
jgi:hypothetical protein